MITSKRGVSTVVANVLIVLLVIVGIAVIWAVVNPTLEKSATGIQAADCFDVNVEPVSCTIAGSCSGGAACTGVPSATCTTTPIAAGSSTMCTWTSTNTVVVQRGAGAQSNLYGLRLLVTSAGVTTTATASGTGVTMGSGTTAGTVLAPLPGQLESKSYSVGAIAAGSTFNVAAVLGTAAENQVCEVLTQPINCA